MSDDTDILGLPVAVTISGSDVLPFVNVSGATETQQITFDSLVDSVNTINNGLYVLTSGSYIPFRLSDNAGVGKVLFLDSDNVTVASINSDGDITADSVSVGNLTSSGCVVIGGGLSYNNSAGIFPLSASAIILTDPGKLYVQVDTEGGILSSGSLCQIHPASSMRAGTIITLTTADSSRDVYLMHNTGGAVQGKLYLSTHFYLDNTRDVTQFMLQGNPPTTYWWCCVAKQDNAA